MTHEICYKPLYEQLRFKFFSHNPGYNRHDTWSYDPGHMTAWSSCKEVEN